MAETTGQQERLPQRQQRAPAAAEQALAPAGPAANPLLALQQTVGNQAVQHQIRTGTLPPGVILGQQGTLGNQAVQRLLQARALQAKLTVTAPDDVYEQAADRVAEPVTAAPLPATIQRLHREAAAQRKGEEHEARTAPGSASPAGIMVIQRKITPARNIDNSRLNVIGERHSESEKREESKIETYYFKQQGLARVEENTFVIGEDYGDLPHLMVANMLEFIGDTAKSMKKKKLDKAQASLDFLRQLIDRKIPGMLGKDGQMKKMQEVVGVDKDWLQKRYDYLIELWDHLRAAKDRDNKAEWVKYLDRMTNMTEIAIVYLQRKSETGSLRKDRSVHMHEFATHHKDMKVAWKIGDAHVKDIMNLEEKSAEYNLITRDRFNELLIDQEYEDQGQSISKSKIRKNWKRAGLIVES